MPVAAALYPKLRFAASHDDVCINLPMAVLGEALRAGKANAYLPGMYVSLSQDVQHVRKGLI